MTSTTRSDKRPCVGLRCRWSISAISSPNIPNGISPTASIRTPWVRATGVLGQGRAARVASSRSLATAWATTGRDGDANLGTTSCGLWCFLLLWRKPPAGWDLLAESFEARVPMGATGAFGWTDPNRAKRTRLPAPPACVAQVAGLERCIRDPAHPFGPTLWALEARMPKGSSRRSDGLPSQDSHRFLHRASPLDHLIARSLEPLHAPTMRRIEGGGLGTKVPPRCRTDDRLQAGAQETSSPRGAEGGEMPCRIVHFLRPRIRSSGPGFARTRPRGQSGSEAPTRLAIRPAAAIRARSSAGRTYRIRRFTPSVSRCLRRSESIVSHASSSAVKTVTKK